MKKRTVKIFTPIFIVLLITGIVFIPISVMQFVNNLIVTRDNIRSFDDERELFSYSPNNSSGTYNLASFIFLPRAGKFELKLYCDSATGRINTPYVVSLAISANISGVVEPVNLAAASYMQMSFLQPDGSYYINPFIDQSWESNEYSVNSNMTLSANWSCNFNGWALKVLYLNDTLKAQRVQLSNAIISTGITFGLGLGLSITSLVIGSTGISLSIIYFLLERRRKAVYE